MTTKDQFLTVLSMDVYRQGYGSGLEIKPMPTVSLTQRLLDQGDALQAQSCTGLGCTGLGRFAALTTGLETIFPSEWGKGGNSRPTG